MPHVKSIVKLWHFHKPMRLSLTETGLLISIIRAVSANKLQDVQKILYEFNVFHVGALYYTKTLITNKCAKRVLSSPRSRPAVQAGTAESSRIPKQRSTQSTARSHSTIKCKLSVTITKKFSLKVPHQQGRNMYACVTIDDKTLFVHLLVISLFVILHELIAIFKHSTLWSCDSTNFKKVKSNRGTRNWCLLHTEKKLCNHVITCLHLNAPAFILEQRTRRSSDYGSNVTECANYPNIMQTERSSKNMTCCRHAVFACVETNIKTRNNEVKKAKINCGKSESVISPHTRRQDIMQLD
jgi:hypothetical protein